MFITKVISKGKDGQTYTSVLLRKSVRVGSRVKSKTIAVLTHLPPHVLEAVQRAIAQPVGSTLELIKASDGKLQMRQGPSFGAVWVVDQIAQRLGIKTALGTTDQARRGYWQVLARALSPGISLQGMLRMVKSYAAASISGWPLSFDEKDLYGNCVWLEQHRDLIEQRLWVARKTRPQGQLFLYDITRCYLGDNRDEQAFWGLRRENRQVMVGLMTDSEGDPISAQVYQGETVDLKTFAVQVEKLKGRLGCSGVTLVIGEHGMIRAEQKEEARSAGFHFIKALSRPQIQQLLSERRLRLGLFQETIAEVYDQTGYRYILWRSPRWQAEMEQVRQHKFQVLESAVEKANIYLREHPRANGSTQYHQLMRQILALGLEDWVRLDMRDRQLVLSVDPKVRREVSQLDGCYVLETDLGSTEADLQTIHDRYKDLALVEQNFKVLRTGHIELGPWLEYAGEIIQAHALTSMLALKIQRYLNRAWGLLDITVEEGLKELGQLCEIELVNLTSGEVVLRGIPEPTQIQKQLLDALDLTVSGQIPEARLT